MRRKTTTSLPLFRCVALCLSHGANCLHATSVYFYTLLSKPFLRDRIQPCIRFFTCPSLFCCLLWMYWKQASDCPQIFVLIRALKASTRPEPDLTQFLLDLWQLIPHLDINSVRDILSALGQLAQPESESYFSFTEKTQTAKLIIYWSTTEKVMHDGTYHSITFSGCRNIQQ